MEGITDLMMVVVVIGAVVAATTVFIGFELKFCDVLELRWGEMADDLRSEIAIINDEHTPLNPNLHLYVKNIGGKALEGEVKVFIDGFESKIERVGGADFKSGFVTNWRIGDTIDIEVSPSSILEGEGYHHCKVWVGKATANASIEFIQGVKDYTF
jgi:archaellum component FlaG (FlaF/FlaG flagellin family)